MQDEINQEAPKLKRTVLDAEDLVAMMPKLKGHEKFVDWLLRVLDVDKVNAVHSRYCDTPGPQFVASLLEDFRIKLRVDGEEVLESLPQGAFITVSNHPFGALDGITLIYLITRYRPEYKVMVNMVLNYIWAMRPNFIAVDALASDDPKKKAVSMAGIKQAIEQVRSGKPLGFFPAGAVSKINWKGQLRDREWQPSVVRLIKQLKVPVVPIFFHGSNSWWFNFLGLVSWQLRTLRLPAEVFRKCGTELHVSVGQPISVEEQQAHASSVEELGEFLKSRTYELEKIK
ncbi:MAG: lysophospholipid acyltransferase family protein [Muribaculaceae bacterium]